MLITCKQCESIYCIADKIISPLGRKVRCARCSNVWMVSAQEESPKASIEPDYPLPMLVNQRNRPKYNILITIILVFTLALIGFIFFPEKLIRFQTFKDIYRKCGIYDSKGLILDNFSFNNNENKILIEGLIRNDSLEDKFIPEIRYVLLNQDKEKIFSFTNKAKNQLIAPGKTYPIKTKIINIRPLSKLASVKGFEGESERRAAVYTEVHEDSSTEATRKSPTEVEFRKRSIQENTAYIQIDIGNRLELLLRK
jgi:predicted Zn finger-like uncharacterized protein/RPE1 domain-containing protein